MGSEMCIRDRFRTHRHQSVRTRTARIGPKGHSSMFVQGQVYRRRDLHTQFGVQQQGGINTPSKFTFVLLFTGDSGAQHGYRDGWQEDGLFSYTGEGQIGERFVLGNRAIRDHTQNEKDLPLFEQAHHAHVRYIGQFVCSGSHLQWLPERDGSLRQAIIFELTPIAEFTQQLRFDD